MKYYYFIRYEYSGYRYAKWVEDTQRVHRTENTIYVSDKQILTDDDLKEAADNINSRLTKVAEENNPGKWFFTAEIINLSFLYERED